MINILVTLNANYINPLKVMLTSLHFNNPEENFTIYLVHSSLKEKEVENLKSYVNDFGYYLKDIYIDNTYFTDAPTLLHYTKEMYYRLLAFKFLPKDLERILYLDPDTLVLNPLSGLYNIDLKGYLYAAAYHNIIPTKEINKIRLGVYDMDAYYNSGVLLMNLDLQRQLIREEEIFDFVKENKSKLIMPDQDVINALYSKYIKTLEEKCYNYDARYFSYYKIRSSGKWDMAYVLRNTVVLHFCGKKKPWKKDYSGKFHSLYKHYEKLALG